MSLKSICLILFACLFGLTTGYAQTNLSDGLLAYWPLDEGSGGATADVSGNGSEGTLNGGPNWVAGKLGNALEFDGSDDYVDVGNGAILDLVGPSDFTISAWINTSARGGETIFSKGGDNGGGIRYRLYIEGNPGVKILVDDDSTKYDPEGNIAVEDGQWHHLVGMRDGTALRVFVDGVEDEGVTAHSESTIPADYDISGTSQHGAYIGCLTSHTDASLIKFFSGMIDDVAFWNRALTLDEIAFLWNNGDGNPAGRSDPGKASDPSIADGADNMPRDVVLGWSPGDFANTHDVYFGTTFDDVNDASVANPRDVLASAGQDGSTLSSDRLAFGQTYYWRVDEVNAAPDLTVYKGDVWTFTIEPIAVPILQITATAGAFGASGPEKTIDGSGLMDDLHGVSAGDMWISDALPATIEYAFDQAYSLHELWVWNSNQVIETFVGYGAKDIVIEYSLDGENWTALEGVGPLAQAPGAAGYAHNNTIDLGGVTAQYVRVTINSAYGTLVPQVSLSEVRFFSIPTAATGPNPETGASAVDPDVFLSWARNGRGAASHNVYVGSDANNLSLAASVNESSFDTSTLDLALGQRYFWRVDEVNDAMDPSTWASEVWSFTTVDTISVDDMERYRDEALLEPWATWKDGFDLPAANGSLIGVGPSGAPETGIVHGGGQSLPMFYDNRTATQSEATRTFDAPMNWTGHGVQGLVLYFNGSGDNTGGSLYVKINGTKVAYDGDPAALMRAGWSKWYIPLAGVAGDLSRVTSLTLGVDSGGAGMVYFDDIHLTADARELVTPLVPSTEGLLVHWAFDEGAGATVGDSSINNHTGTISNAIWNVGGFDGSDKALRFGGGGFVVNSDTLVSQINGLSAVTVAVWIKSDLTDTDHGIVNFIDPDNGDNGGMRYDAAGASFSGTNVVKISLPTTGGLLQLESSSGAQTTEWQHVAMSWQSGSTLELYINGMADTPTGASEPAVGTVDTVTQLLVGKGGKDLLVSDGWEGLIDDVRLYTRVLSEGELAGLAGRMLPFDKP